MPDQKINEERQQDALPPLSGMVPGEPDFYIGWQAKAPGFISRFVKKALYIIFPIAIVLAGAIAALQKKFSTANFEFGTLTHVEGIYFSKPVPSIKVATGKNVFGILSYVTIPLVGFGKHGAVGIIQDLQKQKGYDFNSKILTLQGTLLYNDGKLLMQIDANDNPLLSVNNHGDSTAYQESKDLGMVTLKGEIVDPKCFFGVMKPGNGKVHKDCAIRCILGGIPPVLKVQNDNGEMNFYLLVGPGGEMINTELRNFVAEPIQINARAVQQGDWIVLFVSKEKIKPIARRELFYSGMEPISCAVNTHE